VAGRHCAQRRHDRPSVIADGGPHTAESEAALLVVDGVPLVPHATKLGMQRGPALDGATSETRQAAANQTTSKLVRRERGEKDLTRRRRVSGHSPYSHVNAKGMRALNQVNAHRAEPVQHAQIHGLPRPRP
jgi:hypothetical protein